MVKFPDELMESTELARLRRVTGKQTTRLTIMDARPGSPTKLRSGSFWRRQALHRHRKRKPPVGTQRSEDTKDQVVHRRRDLRGQSSLPHRPRRARTSPGCDSTEVLDVSAYHGAWAHRKRNGSDARQYRIVRGHAERLNYVEPTESAVPHPGSSIAFGREDSRGLQPLRLLHSLPMLLTIRPLEEVIMSIIKVVF